MTLYQIHCDYLHKFGTERFKKYCINLGKWCLRIGLDYPYEEELSLEEYLEKHNLWFTMYL